MSSEAAFLPEIVGHDRPRALLRAALLNDRIPTGYLFCGESGRGKHSTARQWLRVLLCEADRLVACGRCEACVAFDDAIPETGAPGHPDVRELAREDGKTMISIERVRELKEWFSLAPFRAPRRCAVINEADRLSEEAQNSLLKLLEEPPGRGLLLLISSDPGGLLETIVSRLQRIYFGPLTEEDVRRGVGLVTAGAVPDEEIDRVATVARGSVGAAIELLSRENAARVADEVRRLLDPRVGPFAWSESLFKGKGAFGRRDVADLLDAALELVTSRLHAALGTGEGASDVLADAVPADLEAALTLILEARARLDGNVTPRLVVEGLKIRLARTLLAAR